MQDMRVDKQERHKGEVGIMRDCCCEVYTFKAFQMQQAQQ